jgi:hypothetical protein
VRSRLGPQERTSLRKASPGPRYRPEGVVRLTSVATVPSSLDRRFDISAITPLCCGAQRVCAMLDTTSPRRQRTYRFGPFRLMPMARLLMKGDKAVPIGSRALEILASSLCSSPACRHAQRCWPRLQPAFETAWDRLIARLECGVTSGMSAAKAARWLLSASEVLSAFVKGDRSQLNKLGRGDAACKSGSRHARHISRRAGFH